MIFCNPRRNLIIAIHFVEEPAPPMSFFLEPIPPSVYREMEDILRRKFHFLNGAEQGGKMRLAEYFVGCKSSLAKQLFEFGEQLFSDLAIQPTEELPNGFTPPHENLSPLEQRGGAAFFHLDVAITEDGVKLVEFQAVPTYQVTGACLSALLQSYKQGTLLFLGRRNYGWEDFYRIMRDVLVGDCDDGHIIVDRQLTYQKTNFEFYATKQLINPRLDIVDAADLYGDQARLVYRLKQGKTVEVRRLYNRVLALEALNDDAYPNNPDTWRFRYDRTYRGLQYCNHPARSLTMAKQHLTTINHPFNPPCYDLADVADKFSRNTLAAQDYVWKHKQGVAGRQLFLSPTLKILTQLQQQNRVNEYLAQKKIHFKPFLTADGKTKIVELRLMFVQSESELIAVPMARIGHLHTHTSGTLEARIHFGQNNQAGYGFAPVLLYP